MQGPPVLVRRIATPIFLCLSVMLTSCATGISKVSFRTVPIHGDLRLVGGDGSYTIWIERLQLGDASGYLTVRACPPDYRTYAALQDVAGGLISCPDKAIEVTSPAGARVRLLPTSVGEDSFYRTLGIMKDASRTTTYAEIEVPVKYPRRSIATGTYAVNLLEPRSGLEWIMDLPEHMPDLGW